MNESPEEKYCRLQSEIQRAILRNYPNLERRGCPGDAVLRNLGMTQKQVLTESRTSIITDCLLGHYF